MSVAQILGPTDVETAFVSKGGELVVIDGRGTPWTYDTGVKKNAAGKEIEGPAGFNHAFVMNERLVVLDGSDVFWTYDPAYSAWAEGFSLEDRIEPQSAEEEEAAATNPWSKGRNVEARLVHPDEKRRAEATLDALEQAEKAEEERKKAPKPKKAKEHA